MKNRIKVIIASVLALLISIPTIIEGTSVISGTQTPDQVVLMWLVYYNVIMAVVSLFAVILFWTKENSGQKLAYVILFGHLLILIFLLYIHFSGGRVAIKSIMAMSIRSAIWGIIIFLNQITSGRSNR